MTHAPSRGEPVTAWRTSCHVRRPASTWPAAARSRRLVASSTGVPDTSGSPVTTSPVASPIRAAGPQRDCGASGLKRVVVARRGDAEHSEQAPAAEVLHGRAVGLEHAPRRALRSLS